MLGCEARLRRLGSPARRSARDPLGVRLSVRACFSAGIPSIRACLHQGSCFSLGRTNDLSFAESTLTSVCAFGASRCTPAVAFARAISSDRLRRPSRSRAQRGVALGIMFALTPNPSLQRTAGLRPPAAELMIRYPAGHHFFSVAGNLGGFGEASGSSGFGTIFEAERFRPSGWPHDAVPSCCISTSATRPLALAVSDPQPMPLGPRWLGICGRRYNNSLKRTRSAAGPGFAGSTARRAA